MKLSLQPLDVKYDYLNNSIPLTDLQKAHSIYATSAAEKDWRESVFYAKEEIKLSLDLLYRTRQDLKITETFPQKKDFDLKRLLSVKESDLVKILSKFTDTIKELKLEKSKREEWTQFIQKMKSRNWVIFKKFKSFFLDFGFKKVGSNLDFQVFIKDCTVNLENFVPVTIKLKMDGKSSKISDLNSSDFEFGEIERRSFSVFDQEIIEIVKRGDLEEEYKNLKKGNGWNLRGFKFLEIDTGESSLQDKELDVLVILLRYRMLKVYKRNFRNRGVINKEVKSAATSSQLMVPVVMAYADFIVKKGVAQVLDLFYKRNSRILEYLVSVNCDKIITTWTILLFSRWELFIIFDSEADNLTLKAQEYVWSCSLSNLYTLLMREVGRLCLFFAVYEFKRFARLEITKGSLDHSYIVQFDLRKSYQYDFLIHLKISLGIDCLILENEDSGMKQELAFTSIGNQDRRFKDRLRKYILLILS